MSTAVASLLEQRGATDGGRTAHILALSAWGGDADGAAGFFEGRVRDPHVVAAALVQLSRVVGARFHVPPAMRERILRESDPIVTFGGGALRFEGFSSCASAYARLDVDEEGLEVAHASRGTTNVDFNEPLRAALAGVRDGDALDLRVDPTALAMARHGRDGSAARVVEEKVDLPRRWLRGLVEVQAYLARMRLRFSIGSAEALRFLRDLPRSKAQSTSWVVPAGAGLRLAFAASAEGVRASSLERLRLLEPLAPRSRGLRVYADDDGQASAWVLDFSTARFILAITQDARRGFSGEGQALRTLASLESSPELRRAVASVRAALLWQPRLDVGALADQTGVADPALFRAALEVLGASGLCGFDPVSVSYFHRVLPYDLSRVDLDNPRLVGARDLVARGAVSRGQGAAYAVATGSGEHLVRADDRGRFACTCPWSARHEGARGPCKHVLAVEMVIEGEAKEI